MHGMVWYGMQTWHAAQTCTLSSLQAFKPRENAFLATSNTRTPVCLLVFLAKLMVSKPLTSSAFIKAISLSHALSFPCIQLFVDIILLCLQSSWPATKTSPSLPKVQRSAEASSASNLRRKSVELIFKPLKSQTANEEQTCLTIFHTRSKTHLRMI